MKPSRFLALAVLLAACNADVTSPSASASATASIPSTPSTLLAPGEWYNEISYLPDGRGNMVMIGEYAAGFLPNDTTGYSAASVTIRTVIPQTPSGSSKSPCITSTIVGTDVRPGWTASVKKPGGCDKEIQVQFENRSTQQRFDFSFLYLFGKTRIDGGLIQ